MALIGVKKLSAIILAQDTKKVMHALQKAGVFHVTKTSELSGVQNSYQISSLEAHLSEVRYAISTIKKYDSTKPGFLTAKPEIESGRLFGESERTYHENIGQIRHADEHIGALRQKITKLESRIIQLEPFSVFELTAGDLAKSAHSSEFIGFVPKENIASVREIDLPLCEIFESEGEQYIALLAVCHISTETELRAKLRECSFTDVRTDDIEDSLNKHIALLKTQKCELDAEFEKKRAETEQLFTLHRPVMLEAEDYLQNEISRENAIASLGQTGKTHLLTGYIKDTDERRVIGIIESTTDYSHIELTYPDPDEQIPTVIENNKILTPFEAVTDLYSVPVSRSLDPVYILAPFYFIFFGMMLSDAAYGVALAAGAILILLKKKPSGMFRKISTLLAVCSVSVIIWGVLFGGIFAIDGVPALWFNPLTDPMTMLILCIGIGWVHLLVALGTGAFMLIKRKKVLAAIFDKGFWMLFLTGIPFLALGGETIGLMMMGGAALGLLLTQGRHKKGIVKKAVGGLASLYDVTAYISDLLSYSRIFGLALATSVIGLVFNTIGSMLMGNDLSVGSIIGWVFAIVVLLIGHGFNLALSTLGAYVHASRLQYIESFFKFFEGGGKIFKPLSVNTRNFRIKE